MEEALGKIRPHTSSSLAHQKKPATLLKALEATFEEQKTERTSTAYFAALLTTVEGTLQKKDTGLQDDDILPAELYLLALVAPFVPQSVIRSNLNLVLSLTAPLWPLLSQYAPPLKSQLGLYNAVFTALERSQLETPGIRRSFASILQLCLDPRPKVRKKAAEVAADVLSGPPPPMARHPYSQTVSDWVISTLKSASDDVFQKNKHSNLSSADSAIHLVAFLRHVFPRLPPSSLAPIASCLITLPRLGNAYLSQSAYSLLAELFSSVSADGEVSLSDEIPAVLKAITSSAPPKTDTIISPAWVAVLGEAMVAYHTANAGACAADLEKVWRSVWAFLDSNDAPTRKATAESLGLLAQCFTPELIQIALREVQDGDNGKSAVIKIINQTTKALDSLPYARSIPELLVIISSLVENLAYRAASRPSTTAAESLLIPLIGKISQLRVQKGFEYKEDADAVLSTAMRVIGPQVLLRTLPLNVEPEERQAGQEPRAYLLPLLAQPHPSPLSHFISYFVPLSERMFDLQQKAENEGRQSEAKVWSVLVSQVWAGFPGYCWASPDLKEALNPPFCSLLSQLLYSQEALRPPVLRGLKVLVESTMAMASTNDKDAVPSSTSVQTLTPEEAIQSVQFLRAQAESWLAVLFNVFGSVPRDSRGMVGDVITTWLTMAGEQEIAKVYQNVIDLLKQNLATTPASTVPGDGNSVTATTQDLLILLLPHLSEADGSALSEMCLSKEVLNSKDNGVQKRGYKILAKLAESGKFAFDTVQVLQRLDEFSEGLSSAAKKDRFILLIQLIPAISSTDLHILPSLIPEAVLGTKEPSEKARAAAFELVVVMGKKMSGGGVVKRAMVDGMDDDSAGEAAASIEEYLTMIAAGLAGATPHMISATITAISRLVFEFKNDISSNMLNEILATHLVFLSSANREVVKSTLGFIKLAIHTLPAELLRPHLDQLVPALLGWSHDHKNHFKVKVRHIFEHMIRKLGWENVYACAGEEEGAKVLLNIKKRKDRAKRKKLTAGNQDEDAGPVAKRTGGDAFEDVLYGSESEVDDSDDDEVDIGKKKSKKGAQKGSVLRIDNDEPMNLLEGVATRLTTLQSKRRRKPGQDAAHFKADEDTGKMIIESDADSDVEQPASVAAAETAGTAYRETITSVDGFTRGRNGRVKFNKDTKKRRREMDDVDEDVEMGDETKPSKSKAAKWKEDQRPGHEFKSKRAGGDVKKGGVDPYAYVPLSQAAKKRDRKPIGIAGKR